MHIPKLKKSSKLIVFFLLFFSQHSYCQEIDFKFMFWNVENFFDTRRDSSINDADFTPTGKNRWTYTKFLKKRDDLAKIIIGHAPIVVGLCEIENYYVLKELTTNSILGNQNWGIIHKDSPDSRGIDVAAIYNSNRVRPLHIKFYSIDRIKTRLILYSKLLIDNKDTIHFFANHFPSKLNNVRGKSPNRELAAKILLSISDSIFATNSQAKIVLCGDFNENYTAQIFEAYNNNFNNLSINLYKQGKGTYKYLANWDLIDMFFVSKSITKVNMQIVDEPYLLEEDKKYLGQKVRRKYIGPRYNKGVSDHLPIILNFIK